MSLLQNSNAISAGGYDINNSLRFRSSASAYLSRTPASAGNRTTWTWSGWVKLGKITDSSALYHQVFGTDGNNGITFMSGDTIQFSCYNGTGSNYYIVTTQVFRDPSSWYHIVAIWDSSNATASDRQRLYINGQRVTAFSSGNAIPSGAISSINSGVEHDFGRANNATIYWDGYLAEVNFIDGQALTPSSFGETDAVTGSWVAKKYTGTYGTNGFYLKFSDIATTSGSNAGLGKDFSGNTNYWTTNNISVTSGTTYDAMTDSPTNTSATVANYAVLSPLAISVNNTYKPTDGNLNITLVANGQAISTIAPSSGKWYAEFIFTGGTLSTDTRFGVELVTDYTANYVGSSAGGYCYSSDGTKGNNNSFSAYGATWTTNDVIGIAFDIDGGSITFYKNGTSQGTAYTGIPSGTYGFVIGNGNSATNNKAFTANFGQRPFSYTPPTGYNRLNTYNLPDSTIKKGNSYMDATTYTGTGATQVVTNSGSMKPDLVWLKSRSVARDHRLMDTVRGINLGLQSNLTSAEYTGTALSSINSNGFTLNTTDNQNVSSETYIAWQWQAGQGTNTTNTSGSITSTVSVNATAGFSVVTYTGNGTAGATVGHGLGVSPAMTIIKSRLIAANSWCVWQKSFSTTQTLYLDSTTSLLTRDRMTGVSNTTFTIGSHTEVNTNASTYVAYCLAEIAGFSKFGSYTGNGSADGPFVYCGFRPRFVLVKCSSAAGGSWVMYDTSRNQYNLSAAKLAANLSEAENGATVGGSTLGIDVLANGFKHRNDGGANHNASGATYIFAAFAENPFKNSLAR